MSKWLWLATCLALPLWSAEHEAPATVALYVDFDQAPSPVVLDALQQEAEIIMAPMGTEFEWRSLKLVTGGQVSRELAVVRFRGRCDGYSELPLHPPSGGALGWTHVSDGVILPFADIDCDGIRQFIQAGLLSLDSKQRNEFYGRAVGRVLAHELYHIFGNTAHHGAHGVGKAAYSVQDLLSRDFHFEDHESQVLRSTHVRPVEDMDSTH